MNRLFNYLNTAPAVLVMAVGVVSLPARASVDSSKCDVDAGIIQVKSVNLQLGKYSDGEPLDSGITYNIRYTCTISPDASIIQNDYAPSLMLNDEIKPFVTAINNYGLGINIYIAETGRGEVRIPWETIKNPASGRLTSIKFGAHMDPAGQPSREITRTGTIRLELIAVQSKVNGVVVLDIPKLSALNIMSNNHGYGLVGKPIKTSAFSLRILPEKQLGSITVTPREVKMGHIYTTDLLTKTVPFSVTAKQTYGAGVGISFDVPLMINFIPESKLTALDNQSVRLVNKDGVPNGLKLSVSDGKGAVKLNTPAPMGTIHISDTADGLLKKDYTATVEQIPGETPVTGKFEASMSVVATYN
ncbi:fimbrial protein [Salmonella enterica subsp. enterica serovar Waycross]|nr:fimbrial protein [Salmonella enterica subsp. enterica serovar Waycross]